MDGDAQATADADLVRRVVAGDASAFTALVDRHARSCLRFATRLLGQREDAEDAAQETFMRAFRALGTYDPRIRFRTWLFAILVNRCRTALLHRSRRERRVEANGAWLERVAVQRSGDEADLRVELSRAIGLLPAEQREAFLLKHVEQLEYTEMAEVTGVGVSALKMRVQRACAQLRVELRELRDD
jgi:RNA polymerase sigma-70 factor (ECF subfamily)